MKDYLLKPRLPNTDTLPNNKFSYETLKLNLIKKAWVSSKTMCKPPSFFTHLLFSFLTISSLILYHSLQTLNRYNIIHTHFSKLKENNILLSPFYLCYDSVKVVTEMLHTDCGVLSLLVWLTFCNIISWSEWK